MTEDLQYAVLDRMVEDHLRRHGESRMKLRESAVLTTNRTLAESIPGLTVWNANICTSKLSSVAKELESKGMTEFNVKCTEFWLTEKGFDCGLQRKRHASRTCLTRFIDYLNANPGWATPISVLALLVAIAAVCVPALEDKGDAHVVFPSSRLALHAPGCVAKYPDGKPLILPPRGVASDVAIKTGTTFSGECFNAAISSK